MSDNVETSTRSEFLPESGRSQMHRAVDQKQPTIVREFWDYLKTSKSWWLLPIIVALMIIGVLVMLSGTAAAPYVYTLF